MKLRKLTTLIAALGLVAFSANAITTNITNREIRDPRQLKVILDDNFYSLESTPTFKGPIQQAAAGTGYSYNLINVTNSTQAGNLRGWRVNVTGTTTNTDLQCVHGYLTGPATPTFAANAAVYPLSAWLDLPDTTTFAGAAVVSGVRAIIDANNNTLGSASASVESAIFYGQTWASAGTIDAGLFIAAGAGTTIDSVLEIGGSGTMGVILDLRSMQTSGYADNLMTLVRGGPQDATAQTHFGIYVGDSATRSAIAAETPATSQGSLYINTTGELFICVTQPGSGADQWEKVTTTAAD